MIDSMKVVQLDNMRVTLDREGARTYTKASYPIRYGRYAEIDYEGYIFQYNLNGEIRHIGSAGPDWPHPAEWLKRTIGNDWVYYSTGGYYTGTADLFGEFYMVCPAYQTNSLFKENPFSRPGVAAAFEKLEKLTAYCCTLARQFSATEKNTDVYSFLRQIGSQSNRQLQQKADRLHRILSGKITVLPPDCRHVDYDVMPVMLSQGCLYNCSFCQVKTGLDFGLRSRENIIAQLQNLKEFFGPDLANYNAIFWGQHDALAAAAEDILFGAEKAYELLEISQSSMRIPRMFLFGSADSFLQKDDLFFANLDRLPFYTYINLGLESFDAETLEVLKKPVPAEQMKQAFARMLDINRQFEHIEITANFLLGEELPASHIPSLIDHLHNSPGHSINKGCIYMSPLQGLQETRKTLDHFRDIKQKSRLETLLYLIQRL